MSDNPKQDGRDEYGRFQIANLFGKDNNGGQPAKYSDPKVFHEKIYEYLKWEERSSKGKYTVEGAALYLGFASRQSLYDYKERSSEFSYSVERFNTFMTHYHAQRLTWGGSMPGSMFWLKNFGGYKEESTQNQNQVVTHVEIIEKKRDEK